MDTFSIKKPCVNDGADEQLIASYNVKMRLFETCHYALYAKTFIPSFGEESG